MTPSYIDTTVAMGLADDATSGQRKRCDSFVRSHQPSDVPYYAAREILAGPVSYYCQTHNTVLSASNAGEALVALTKKAGAGFNRTHTTGVRLIGEALDRAFRANGTMSAEDSKREVLQDIMLRAGRLWQKVRRPRQVTYVQPLACFRLGELGLGTGGELRGPSGTFSCDPKERCSAAGYMFDDQAALNRMIDALHPRHREGSGAEKRETGTRRKALKDLANLGPKEFKKTGCRALGDAYFAAMCPTESLLGTTNMIDFAPLCKALGKKLQKV